MKGLPQKEKVIPFSRILERPVPPVSDFRLRQIVDKVLLNNRQMMKRVREHPTADSSYESMHTSDGVSILTESAHFPQNTDVMVYLHQATGHESEAEPPAPHRHNFYECTYICQGKFVNEFEDGSRITVQPDTLVLLNPHVAHAFYPCQAGSLAVNILLRKSYVETTLLNSLSGNKVFFHFFFNSIYGNHHNNNYLIFEKNEEFRNLIFGLIHEICDQKLYYEQLVESYLNAIFALLVRRNQQQLKKEWEKYEKGCDIEDILTYLRTHYSDISIQKTAEIFHYSTGYLSRIIKKQTGKSFTDLITELRFAAAQNYLLKSVLSVDQISELVGYHDTSYFCKIFKKKYGMSPASYRKRYQQEQSLK